MAVSFSGKAKAEICKAVSHKACCARALCFGILLYCNSFSADGIRIVTECRDLALLLPKLFRKAFGIQFDVVPESDAPGKQVYQILDRDKLITIMESFGFAADCTPVLHVNLPVVENDCCKVAFLRGVFLAGGSVTDPEKGYHLEMVTTHASVSRETYTLLHEVLGSYSKVTSRAGTHILYFKQSELISDYLTLLGAPIAAMGIMETRLEKELNNKVNRRCNCDEANTSKVVEAAQEQLMAIRILRQRGVFEKLPKKMLEAAIAREENPAASLTELAALMQPPITKPAMNHRLKNLILISKEAVQ